jgi:PAS domain S-box-containing protein/diguanylate cyclase (GGDEF)-like protein
MLSNPLNPMQWLEYYLDNSPVVFFKWHNQSGWPVEYVSANVVKITGYPKEEFLNQTIHYAQLIHPDDLERVTREVVEASQSTNGDFEHLPYRIITKEGEVRWVSDITKIQRDNNGIITIYYGYINDITDLQISRENLRNSLWELDKAGKLVEGYFEALDTGYILSTSDLDGNITYVNDNFVQISGYSREELMGKGHNILRHPDVSKETFEELWTTIKAKKSWNGRLQNRKKNGSSYYIQITIQPILDEHGEIEQFLAIRYDMTEQVLQQEHINLMALHSTMTGLPNLYALVRDIEIKKEPLLGIVNIDGFKILNNHYGYKTGDLIIQAIANLIRNELTSEDVSVYHIHADEFGVLGDGCLYDKFINRLETFQKEVHLHGFTINDKIIPIHLSIATSDESIDRLLVSCNMAIHFARSHNEKFVRYDQTIDFSKNYDENIRWTTLLHEAIEHDLIQPYFQPIYDIRTRTVKKYEALIRICKGAELFTPFFFLEIAKKVKLYPEISMIMLEKTFGVIQREPYDFSINLSVEDMMNHNYTQRLFELLEQERLGGIILEIVESEGIENFDEVNRFIEKAKSFGCRIAIDDFGTGYSNFEYLIKLNADFLKIDGSLIKNIDTDIDAEDIVSTMVSFAKKKNIPVIAEFVSSEAIFDKIESLGIEYAQGYFIGKPEKGLHLFTLPRQ